MLTAASAFALFVMLALASPIYYIAERIRLPYTVLLTLAGVLLVPLSNIDAFHFLREFSLTPELLFYIFLPTLIFESAYNMHLRRVVQDSPSIMVLAVLGYLVSAFAIAGGLWLILDIFGIAMPFMIALLFGALISATDPVAVLALFKEYGAPRRLSTIFEGESLMNDATALALFLIVLSLIATGISGFAIGMGALTFASMLVGGAIFGTLAGAVVTWIIGFFRNNEVVAITLMLVLAHLTFISSELINEVMRHHDLGHLQLSPIIATTIASLFMGAYGRYKITPRAEEFIEKFWSQFAFMANSVIFILVGFLVANVPVEASELIIPISVAVIIVAVARALSVYGTVIPFNLFVKATEKIPLSWQHLLAWGSLRGALAVMLVLLIPADLSVPGWTFSMPIHDFLLILTITCVFATLFIKAPLVQPIMKALRINILTPLEEAARDRARAIVDGTTVERLQTFIEKGYVPPSIGSQYKNERGELFQQSSARVISMEMTERSLRIYLIGREKEILKELLTFDEVTERVFKRIDAKLSTQAEEAEHGNMHPDPHQTYDYRDVFENIAEFFRSILSPDSLENEIREEFLYYRAQEILARKATKELERLLTELGASVYPKNLIEKARAIYSTYQTDAEASRKSIAERFPEIAESLDETLLLRSIFRVEEASLAELYHRQLLTPKLYATLLEEYRTNANAQGLKTKRTPHNRLTISKKGVQ
ncbi:MAG: hypothetical protein RLZZ283_519 [Candidatus Parcubacteria bacterium]|jgi:CPA1 family monovalent cation:H+ antiporter